MQNNSVFSPDERVLIRGHNVDCHQVSSWRGWYPVAISKASKSIFWRNLRNRRFLEPFFQDSLSTQSVEDRRVCQTPLSMLDAISASLDSVAPTAFIFHVSRCGSTLLTQLLASLPQGIVLSEPPALDAFFRLYHADPDLPDAGAIFKNLMAALGQRRNAHELHFFVKFDSWHLPWLPFVKATFPDVPCILLYREPEAVIASHRRQRGPQVIPGMIDMTRLQVNLARAHDTDLEAFAWQVLNGLFASALDNAQSENVFLLNYSQLPKVLWKELFAVFKLQCTSEQLQSMQQRSTLHSKSRHVPFGGDPTAAKLHNPSPQLVSIVKEVEQQFVLLEARRIAQQSVVNISTCQK